MGQELWNLERAAPKTIDTALTLSLESNTPSFK